MRWIQTCALVVAASTATAGCTVSRNQKVALGGAASTLAGTLVLATDDTDTMPPSRNASFDYKTPVGGVFLVGGLIVLFTAAAMEERLHEPKPLLITIADQSRVDTQARGEAWQLSKAAFLAARQGNCAKVQELSTLIRELDWDMHLTVFLRDAAVQKCVVAADLENLPPERVEPGDPDEAPPIDLFEKLPPPGS
jgi:uncharacterized membrane protein YgdD (TMEM256/DUF423 family)